MGSAAPGFSESAMALTRWFEPVTSPINICGSVCHLVFAVGTGAPMRSMRPAGRIQVCARAVAKRTFEIPRISTSSSGVFASFSA